MPFREWNCCAERFRRMLFQPKSPGSCLLDPVRFLRRVRAWPAAAVICMKCRVHEGIRPRRTAAGEIWRRRLTMARNKGGTAKEQPFVL